jgi:5-formyltetrahydrofolate cyclo-ligase
MAIENRHMVENTSQKTVLREQKKAIRADIPAGQRREMSEKITEFLLDMLLDYDTVLVYVSKEPEVNTFSLISHLLERGTRVVVPIIQRHDHSLRFSFLNDLSCLKLSTFNVPEPIGNEIPADPKEIQVAVIPLIGFDEHGNRLGYGAGYYDRFLEKYPRLMKIGIGFACQETETVPTNRFDITMDYIVTEEGIISC